MSELKMITVRVTPEEHARIVARAASQGLSLQNHTHQILLADAEELRERFLEGVHLAEQEVGDGFDALDEASRIRATRRARPDSQAAA